MLWVGINVRLFGSFVANGAVVVYEGDPSDSLHRGTDRYGSEPILWRMLVCLANLTEVRCPSCGEENPERAKFCLNCATPLVLSPVSPPLQERKVVTVLFCDLVGFTSASESADPEDVQARLASYHSMLRAQIERYGGTVEKFIGDAVMAVFGAPTAHEDDPERAVRAGLRMVAATTELNEDQPGLDLRVRVGVNTGEALVSLSARPERGEGFVTGDVVNTASRLQGAAPVDGVAVAEQTYASTKGIFDYVELPSAELKGKSRRVRLFHAVAARARFGTDLTRTHTTPLVGREIDLALLKGAFDKALSGPSVQLVTVVGEPGVGKSRLVTELFNHVDALPDLVRFRQGRCLPYGDGITFWAIGEIVKAEAGVLDTDDPDTARSKLDEAIGLVVEDPLERSWFADRLSPLLGLSAPAGTREETFTAWRRFLEAAAEDTPLVCVIEDLHWADEALLEFIEHTAEWSQGVPLLIVCTARPEHYEKYPNWAVGLRNRVDISLGPLSETESARLVSALLGRAVLPAQTQTLLVERSGGNPLYAEEFVRMLSDRGLIDGAGRLSVDPAELSFPASVQAIIAARLDTLPAERKAVLQDAAVIGKVFWAGAVAALGSRPAEVVARDLHELSKKELVRPARTSTVAGQGEYSFWHALIRDVAYGGIPRATRAAKHEAAGRWVEGMAGDRVEEYAEILAHHYLTATRLAEATNGDNVDELRTKARSQLLTAARRAVDIDVRRAETLAQSALQVTPVDHVDRPHVETRLAGALRNVGRVDEARQLFQEAIARSERRGNVTQRARAVLGLAILVADHDPTQADKMITQVIATLEGLQPGPELIDALGVAAGRGLVASRYADGAALSDRLLRLLDQGVPVDGAREQRRADALHVRGTCRFSSGDLGGLDDVRAAVALNPNAANFHNNLAMCLRVIEGSAEALVEVEEGLRLATAQGSPGAVLAMQETQLDLFFCLGRWDELIERAPDLVQQSIDIEDEYDQAAFEFYLGWTLLHRGQHGVGELAAACLQRSRRIGDPQVLLPALMVAGAAASLERDLEKLAGLLAEVESALEIVGEDIRPLYLPEIIRLAVRSQDFAFAERLIEKTPPTYPASQASLQTAQAALAEASGDHQLAITDYADAAQRWTALGHVVERAHALLGLGRSRLAASDPGGVDDVLAARQTWVDLGAQPLIAEADALLSAGQRMTS